MNTFTPPENVANEARLGLELRSAQPRHNKCCTPVGIRRATQLANRQPVSVDTLRRMKSYFARHSVDSKGKGWGVDSKGYQAWLCWGGDSGRDWANECLTKLEEKMPTASARDENKWEKAKQIAFNNGRGSDYSYIMGVYKKMKPEYFRLRRNGGEDNMVALRAAEREYAREKSPRNLIVLRDRIIIVRTLNDLSGVRHSSIVEKLTEFVAVECGKLRF